VREREMLEQFDSSCINSSENEHFQNSESERARQASNVIGSD
jgi:hypothetical protein